MQYFSESFLPLSVSQSGVAVQPGARVDVLGVACHETLYILLLQHIHL